ncbi:hypothetical protein BD410DRAFT_794720 [Rickenella mellea]|uniref:Uncharacterized protein n=1 Tax=Rickenella mellea TaxID=50990 RepID=A0A4Y7PPE7_9AGAM|nr:hypothetical protein BD410DRAFT_794720 [Rickenella mellea]
MHFTVILCLLAGITTAVGTITPAAEPLITPFSATSTQPAMCTAIEEVGDESGHPACF